MQVNKKILNLMFVFIIITFSGCGSGNEKIVIPSYTAPKEVAKISKMQTVNKFISDNAYLALWINPNVKNIQNTNIKLKSMLINSIKSELTQTNFIALDPLEDPNGVTLNMEIRNYNFTKEANNISLSLEVVFILSRGVNEFLVKTYGDKKNRYAKNKIDLPSENELASEAVKKIVRYFISDISPLKTYQLREFKPLPKQLKAVVTYAKNKNYKGAIKLMNQYDAKKDENFYYNLAILYEAQASVTENINLLKRAQINYEKAMKMGGQYDDIIVNAKSQFDKFYDLLNKTKQQNQANQALINDRNLMSGSSDDEYK